MRKFSVEIRFPLDEMDPHKQQPKEQQETVKQKKNSKQKRTRSPFGIKRLAQARNKRSQGKKKRLQKN